MIEHKLSDKDKQHLQKMREALQDYKAAAIFLSRDAWDALNEVNEVIWQDIEAQQSLLDECVKTGIVEVDELVNHLDE